MARGIGGVDVIQGLVPDVAALVAAALAQLGSAWFLSALLVLLYWTRPEEEHDVLLVGSLLLVAFGIYRTLKELFALPRPAELLLAPADAPALIRPLYDAAVLGTGYGFPSGHATNSAVVYIGLAAVLGIWTRRRRYATATALVTVVALTRILLGVHYLVDVVAGAALGASVALLGVYGVRQFVDDGVTVTLVLGVFASAGYVVASGGLPESLLLSGAVLGLLGGWQLLMLARMSAGIRPPVGVGSATRKRGLAALALVPLLVAVGSTPVVDSLAVPASGLVGLAVAGVVLAPTVWQGDSGRQRPSIRRR
jgi:membrane-associated phospholipid phosphatase